MTKLYQIIASRVDARLNCQRDLDKGNVHESFIPLRREWFAKHGEMAEALVSELMPSGSGFDSGTTLDLDVSTGEKLVFNTSFHHMDESGSYDGWTDHTITVRPSLIHGFTVSVSGRDRNEIKDYIAETFQTALSETVDEKLYDRLAS